MPLRFQIIGSGQIVALELEFGLDLRKRVFNIVFGIADAPAFKSIGRDLFEIN